MYRVSSSSDGCCSSSSVTIAFFFAVVLCRRVSCGTTRGGSAGRWLTVSESIASMSKSLNEFMTSSLVGRRYFFRSLQQHHHTRMNIAITIGGQAYVCSDTPSGRGGAGTVFRCTKNSFAQVAVKTFSPNNKNEYDREISNLMEVAKLQPKSPFLPQLIASGKIYEKGILVQSSPYAIVTDFVDGMSLSDAVELVEANQMRPPAYSTMMTLLRSSFSALTLLHQHDIVHRDIKPDNIMLRGASVYKKNMHLLGTQAGGVLIDLGLACSTKTTTTPKCSFTGTPFFTNPHIILLDLKQIRRSSDDLQRADVWQLLYSFAAMLSGGYALTAYEPKHLSVGTQFKNYAARNMDWINNQKEKVIIYPQNKRLDALFRKNVLAKSIGDIDYARDVLEQLRAMPDRVMLSSSLSSSSSLRKSTSPALGPLMDTKQLREREARWQALVRASSIAVSSVGLAAGIGAAALARRWQQQKLAATKKKTVTKAAPRALPKAAPRSLPKAAPRSLPKAAPRGLPKAASRSVAKKTVSKTSSKTASTKHNK